MTRARDRLILSGGLLTKPIRESFLGFLQHVADGEVGNPEHDTVQVGSAVIRQTVVTSIALPPSQRVVPSANSDMFELKGGSTLSLEKARERETAWHQASQDVAFITPSLLHAFQAIQSAHTRRGGSKLFSQHLGTLVHQLLEQWDFRLNSKNFLEPLREFCGKELCGDLDGEEKNAIVLDIERLMETFIQSPPYRELQQATVIGREVPFVMPWSHEAQGGLAGRPSGSCVMEGVMDIVYEVAGDIWVGDYKTDRVTTYNVIDYAEAYRHQAQVYAIAASKSLGLDIKGCKIIFLRIGGVVTIMRGVAK